MENRPLEYDYTVAKMFLMSALLFGFIGMLLGVILALQMAWPEFNYILGDTMAEYINFSRIRPIHTSGVIYGFTLSGIFAGWYYIGQRILKVSMAESKLLMVAGKLHFWTYFIAMLVAVVTLFLGIGQSNEYSELEWPLDLVVVVFWVFWGIGIAGLVGIRREKTLYVSMWYFMASFMAVAMLFIMNNMVIPTYFVAGAGDIMNGVSVYSGTSGAMVQWWFGHNAVGFVLTVPLVGMIYYFLPKESGQAVYSYKLSLLGFWSLMFVYVWAGGHHLIYSTVPDWMQTMGSIFSVILILPSWGSAINILLTMKGEWKQVAANPVIKFLILSSTFYMFSTIEGPIQSIKSVNAIAHFTEWIVGHVHDGALGWVGFVIMGSLYHMTPRIFKREIYSKALMNTQFWIQTLGVILYFTSMWIAGITQGMMWRAVDEFGNLAYSFIDSVDALHVYYIIRAVGGILYLAGFAIFIYNIVKTMSARPVEERELQNATPMAA